VDLTHLGEPLEPPPISPARGPPTVWGEFVQARDDRDVFRASDRRTARNWHPQPARRWWSLHSAGLGESL